MSYVELNSLSFEDKLAKLDILIRQFELLEKQYPKAEFGKHVRELQTKRAELTSTIGRKHAPYVGTWMDVVDTVVENPCQEISLTDSIFDQWKLKWHDLKDTPIDWSK